MIAIRFDIDTHYGLANRVPLVLDLLEEAGIRCTFFCVMGPEANMMDIVFLRFLKKGVHKSKLQTKGKGGFLYLVKAALFPKGVGHRNPNLLRGIVERGHEVQPHGWKHIQWQRNLERIDVRGHLRRAAQAYQEVFGNPPRGFASPGRSYNRTALEAFDEAGIEYVGDMDGDVPFRPEGHRHLQVPISEFRTIAEMREEGMTDDDIVDHYITVLESRKDYCCFYEHPDNLFEREFAILRRVFGYIKDRNLETMTHAEVLERFR